MAADAPSMAGSASAKNPAKVRKRAPKACLSCRARKVRCDVSQRGRPCMNCYLDSETCVVTGRASRLRKSQLPPTAANANATATATKMQSKSGPENQHSEHAHERHEHHEHQQQHQQKYLHPTSSSEAAPASAQGSPQAEGEKGGQALSPPLDSPGPPSVGLDSGGGQEEAQKQKQKQQQQQQPHPHSHQHPHQHQHQHHNRHHQHRPQHASTSAPLRQNAPTPAPEPRSFGPPADITYYYYPFLAISNLSGILPQDVNYMEMQGCLRVPTRSLLDEFVQQYFLHVHPILPLLNEGDFWDMYCQQGGGGSVPLAGRMSLFVFQAMLFSTCNFVSRTSIQALGFPSIRAARAALYRRAKLLYDFEAESSPVAIAQGALLLSFWSPASSAGTKNPNTVWLSTAIHHAKMAGAHHYAAMAASAASSKAPGRGPAATANLLKRLWWCCIIRDRILGLGLRRGIQITRAHFDLDAHPPLVRADLADEVERSRVYNPGTKLCLTDLVVGVVELCIVLTDVLTLVFPLDDTPGWGRHLADGGEGRDGGEADRLRQCKRDLSRWHRSVALQLPVFGGGAGGRGASRPGSSGQTSRGLSPEGKAFHHDSVILYTNLMYMYYHSSRVALCHHEVLQIAVADAVPGMGSRALAMAQLYETRSELQDAASGVTECLKELVHRRLARWLPISAVACTALPLFLHILDVKLSSAGQARPDKGGKPAAATQPPETPGELDARTGRSDNDNTTASHRNNDNDTASALKQHRLNILIQAMKTYQPQYDGVDHVSETIRHVINLAQLDGPGIQNKAMAAAAASAAPATAQATVTDWTEILASNPSWYLRLALTMDLALSKSRMPEEYEFPAGLRRLFASASSGSGGSALLLGSSFSAYGAGPERLLSQESGAAASAAAGGATDGGCGSMAVSDRDINMPYMASGSSSQVGQVGGHLPVIGPAAETAAATVPGMTASPSSFLLEPHQLAMTMGMAMGMDLDLDLGLAGLDMDWVDMTGGTGMGGCGGGLPFTAATDDSVAATMMPPPTGGTVTQLPSPYEELSPTTAVASETDQGHRSPQLQEPPSSSSAGAPLLPLSPPPINLDAFSFSAAVSPAATTPGVEAPMPCRHGDGDEESGDEEEDEEDGMDNDDDYGDAMATDETAAANHGHGHGHSNYGEATAAAGAGLEDVQWTEPSWDDTPEEGDLREADRNTAAALLEAMGQGL